MKILAILKELLLPFKTIIEKLWKTFKTHLRYMADFVNENPLNPDHTNSEESLYTSTYPANMGFLLRIVAYVFWWIVKIPIWCVVFSLYVGVFAAWPVFTLHCFKHDHVLTYIFVNIGLYIFYNAVKENQ